ncbi:MAG: ABC transporter substrate-binding protein [Acidimicrobiales bacterium]
MKKRYSRRQFLGYSAATSGAVILAACNSSSSGGTNGDDSSNGSGLPDIEGAELVTDPSDFPSGFNERPEFAEMVAAGTLPPVAERIGQDPLVLRPLDDIGTYGGTIRKGFLDSADPQNANRSFAGPDSLLYWDPTRQQVIPNIARDFELSDDLTELIIHLRRGMRWSDGTPAPADDIIFWRNDLSLNRDLSTGAPSMRVNGQDVLVERIDDFTVLYRSPSPHPLLPSYLASGSSRDVGGQTNGFLAAGGGFSPKHYVSQFLPAYTSQAAADALAAYAGFNGYAQFVQNRITWNLNPELPTLTPWITAQAANQPPWRLAPNPYSVWVDTDGNQLPYIGEITMDLVGNPDVLVLRASNGEFDYQDRSLAVANLPVLVENQERGDYTVHQTPSEQSDFGVIFNLAYDGDPVLGELIRTVEFRRALSLGIERDQINEAFFLGLSTPSAPLPSETSPYFPGEEWRTKWATHDREQANQLLDEIGLTDTDADGFRLRPDGSGPIRLDYRATVLFADFPAIGEMIKGQWADIGIDMNVEQVETSFMIELVNANEIMVTGHQVSTDDPFLKPSGVVLAEAGPASRAFGFPYMRWFASNGRDGVEPPDSLRELKDATEMWREALQLPDEERIEVGKELYRLAVDQVWSIGIVAYGLVVNGMYLASNRLRNVPGRVLNSEYQRSPANTLPQTFYYE